MVVLGSCAVITAAAATAATLAATTTTTTENFCDPQNVSLSILCFFQHDALDTYIHTYVKKNLPYDHLITVH